MPLRIQPVIDHFTTTVNDRSVETSSPGVKVGVSGYLTELLVASSVPGRPRKTCYASVRIVRASENSTYHIAAVGGYIDGQRFISKAFRIPVELNDAMVINAMTSIGETIRGTAIIEVVT